jgi:hypothetical protein
MVMPSDKQIILLKSIIPNSLIFINKFLDTKMENINEITMEQFDKIMKYLLDNGAYIYNNVKKDNFTYTRIKQTNYYSQYSHYNRRCTVVYNSPNVMMIDWDNISLEDIEKILESQEETFAIYKTYNGYHGYCISRYYDHSDFKTLLTMKNLKCDNAYINFTKSFGWLTRVSKKEGRGEKQVEKFIKIIGLCVNNDIRASLIN